MLRKYKTEVYMVNGRETLRLTCPKPECGQKFIVNKKISTLNSRGTSPCPYCYNTAYVEGGAYDELVQTGWKPGEPIMDGPMSDRMASKFKFRDKDKRS